ncbi:MAG: hypothetical protein AAF367_09530 [Pseudomonadota bacterium]
MIYAWCVDDMGANVAIVCGIDSDTFVEALVGLPDRPVGILANKKIADRVVAFANRQMINAPQMRVAKRLDRELAGFKATASRKTVAIPFRLFAGFLVNEVERLAKRIALIFEVEGDRDRLLQYLIVALREEIEDLCLHAKTRLILNDPEGDCLHFNGSPADLIAPPRFGEKARDMLSSKVPPIAWSTDYERLLTLKATVLRSFDVDALREMIDLDTFAAVQDACIEDWCEEMRTLSRRGSTEDFRYSGETALEALEQAALPEEG